jgi:hypothetical protein
LPDHRADLIHRPAGFVSGTVLVAGTNQGHTVGDSSSGQVESTGSGEPVGKTGSQKRRSDYAQSFTSGDCLAHGRSLLDVSPECRKVVMVI